MVVHSPVADSFAVGHNLVGDSLVADKLVGDILVEGILAVGHTPVADNSRDSLAAVDSPAVAAHTPAVLCSVADIAAFLLAADNFVAAADFSFGFVRAAAVLLPVVRNTCKSAPRPVTAGNNSYST